MTDAQMTGYNPIEVIRGAHFQWLPAPFNGVEIFVKVRCLNYTQIKSCGNLSMIEIGDKNKDVSLDDIIELKNTQEALIKATLVIPTFDEIFKFVLKEDFLIDEKNKELQELNKLLESTPETKEKKELQKEIDKTELMVGFILPDDFMGFLVSWALGIDRTDIKKVSKDMLLEAAILAMNGKDNPSGHLQGIFTDVQREDVNKCAWIVYNRYLEEKKLENEINKSGFRMIGGKRSK